MSSACYIIATDVVVREEDFVKKFSSGAERATYRFSRFTKHAVAPSEYEASYDKNVYPRSAFTHRGVTFRLEDDHVKSSAKGVENAVCGKLEIPFIDVKVSGVSSGLKSEQSAFKGSVNSVNSAVYGGKLNNAIVSKIFKVNILGFTISLCSMQLPLSFEDIRENMIF